MEAEGETVPWIHSLLPTKRCVAAYTRKRREEVWLSAVLFPGCSTASEALLLSTVKPLDEKQCQGPGHGSVGA